MTRHCSACQLRGQSFTTKGVIACNVSSQEALEGQDVLEKTIEVTGRNIPRHTPSQFVFRTNISLLRENEVRTTPKVYLTITPRVIVRLCL